MRKSGRTPWVAFIALWSTALAQSGTLGLGDGLITFNTPTFAVQLVKDSQTLYSLNTSSGFNFVPTDMMTLRQNNSNYHLGDMTFRARQVGSTNWTSGDSAFSRRPVTALAASGSMLAAANLAPTLPSNSLLNITREWALNEGIFELVFNVTNSRNVAVEIGALGAPLEFNNIFTSRTAAQTNEECSLFDPYIGVDAGYVQVTPLLGTLPALVVLPVGSSPLEGWRFLPEDTTNPPYYQSQTFEGLYEWQFHTLAYAENEWSGVEPWNAPTSVTLQPGESRTYGLQFRLASSIRGIEDTLIETKRPVAVGIPGYILPADQEGKLFLNYASKVRSISVYPEGALTWRPNTESKNASWVGYTFTVSAWGRARLTITYEDGTTQTVHYYLTKAGSQAIADLGNFLTTSQWYNDTSDPFHRAPSVISYDREVNAIVKDDARVWIAGLSDEAGAGSWLAASMKQYVQPSAEEVAKMEIYVNQTLWGTLQNYNGTVKKSVFFYQPDLVPSYAYPSSIDWTQWWSWNQAAAWATDRAYDYVHVIGAYWSLYRVARNYPDIAKVRNWEWYLNQAVLTVAAMTEDNVGYVNDGLMDETVIRFLLDDLKREGLTANASLVENAMRARESIWSGERYPFGSEMAWDSTGQEGVYAWAKYFNDTTTAINAINSIIAFQPTVPHWGYNGNARRYWDNIYGGKLQRIERQIHHYGSGLNALPLISQFQSDPTDFYLLRTAYGGLSGPLSSIDEGGFASASFHSFEDTLKWDAYSGDYGPNFVGHALGMGTYIIDHPDFGWQAFGGKVLSASPTVLVQTLDPVRRRVFIAPLAILLSLDAGAFSTVQYDPGNKRLTVTIVPKVEGSVNAASAPQGRLTVAQTAVVSGVGSVTPAGNMTQDAGAWVVPFNNGKGQVELVIQ
ncbi:hypothetical protein GLOTRDRAFT_134803 [Gloeophyllum trabeum ATCC 11539]|uniref:Glycoside hydrolase family 43 protein n=1 Tax=Gloeophyllum trabeum (strain ATCC 11539 / FP-39264 / Madison 617) TaxID=670483 RepID=S7S2P3_GLOTA|nr:uncharacterized protein GLOTRDRAFT_134803 [Gloeophyllum trabeum ATCC 11539]EPQ60039.1 hypothetical protein GLOTRDRAFT_134803 [Gloeophyllum trabeum ATCC 11539]